MTVSTALVKVCAVVLLALLLLPQNLTNSSGTNGPYHGGAKFRFRAVAPFLTQRASAEASIFVLRPPSFPMLPKMRGERERIADDDQNERNRKRGETGRCARNGTP